MRLNPDCIRDVLIELESIPESVNITYYFEWDTTHETFPNLQKYPVDTIAYHIHQCNLYGFLFEAQFPPDGFSYMDITPKAHEFLGNVRQNKNWEKVKSIAQKAGSVSIDVLTQIASNVVMELIKSPF